MSHWLRWTGYLFLALAAFLTLGGILLYVITSRDIHHVYTFGDSSVRATRDSASLVRGRHLVEAIAKCQECHGDDYGGKLLSDSRVFGRLAAGNITAGRGGTARFTDADWERALRHGVGPGGRALVFMPSEAFTAMSDDDLAALIGYLRTIPPVDREWPAPEIGPLARVLYLKGGFPLLPATIIDHGAPRRPPASGVTIEYGEYLATVGGCRGCHGSGLDGTGAPDAPDLTRRRLATWTDADFIRALRQGVRPDGGAIDPTKMPWRRSGRMTDDEILAVWSYVRSLPERPAA
jgi:mono/diheme cytochrome c family protein